MEWRFTEDAVPDLLVQDWNINFVPALNAAMNLFAA